MTNAQNKRYRLLERSTQGWTLINEQAVNLTREECDQLIQHYLSLGYSPRSLTAVVDNQGE